MNNTEIKMIRKKIINNPNKIDQIIEQSSNISIDEKLYDVLYGYVISKNNKLIKNRPEKVQKTILFATDYIIKQTKLKSIEVPYKYKCFNNLWSQVKHNIKYTEFTQYQYHFFYKRINSLFNNFSIEAINSLNTLSFKTTEDNIHPVLTYYDTQISQNYHQINNFYLNDQDDKLNEIEIKKLVERLKKDKDYANMNLDINVIEPKNSRNLPLNLYPFQVDTPFVKKNIYYIEEIIRPYVIPPRYSIITYKSTQYIQRMTVHSIFLLRDNILPYRDVNSLIFPEVFNYIKQTDNYQLLIKKDVIKIPDKLKVVPKENKEEAPDLLTAIYTTSVSINIRSLNKKMTSAKIAELATDILNKDFYKQDIPQRLINLFNSKPKLTDEELIELFNPKVEPKVVNEIPVKIDSDTDSDSETESETDDTVIETVIEPQLKFSYNKYQRFTNQSIIEKSIISLIKTNKKAQQLFTDYDTVNLIKDFQMDYKKQKYFNVILFNSQTREVSPQYHFYLNNDNNVYNITVINSIL